MALLVGRDDLASFTGAAYNGYTVVNGNINGIAAVATGSATSLRTGITGFGPNTFVRCGIYEQVGGVGDFTKIREIDVLASAGTPTQNTAISPALTITAGNEYILMAAGDVTSTATGGEYQWSRDTTVTAGLTTIAADYDTLPTTLPALSSSGDGEMYWWLDGTIASSVSPAITETFLDSVGDPLTGNCIAYVTSLAGAELVAATTYTFAAGAITIEDAALGDVDDVVSLCVRRSTEADATISFVCVPATVYDGAA